MCETHILISFHDVLFYSQIPKMLAVTNAARPHILQCFCLTRHDLLLWFQENYFVLTESECGLQLEHCYVVNCSATSS